MNNNEVYEKVRPLTRNTSIFREDQAHGDDTHLQTLADQKKSTELRAHESELKQTGIPPVSSSSNEFSPVTSNEALKMDDENGMTRSYDKHQDKDLILSDVSLRQQRSPADECEYEIDLGNGSITKMLSSHPPNGKQQQRVPSIVSADSIQPVTAFKIPFTNAFSELNFHSRSEDLDDRCIEANALFNSHDYSQPHRPNLSQKTVQMIGIGTALFGLLLLVVFVVF